ncbi:MAG: 5-methyltetrahydropteroyltriglutamate--homocysteine S-methyltransferase [Burkholderiales bacterium]|nr:5-methyltetrahydropteroyltriglutamate--homocysteine S-methyltransferase [Burkholderiales bacterium]
MQRTTPPFRADHVGSLLRPPAIQEARARREHGALSAGGLKAVEDREIERVVRRQEQAGLRSITDGEFRRSWWHLDFLWGLDGVERYAMGQGVAFSGMQTRAEGARVTGKLGFSGHPMIEHFRFLQACTGRTAKMSIPAPSALYGRTGRQAVPESVYPDLDALWADLGEAYRRAVHAFAEAGCRYLQFDEVFIAMLCDENYAQAARARGDDPKRMAEIYADLINAAASGAPPGMTLAMHLCRGNYRSTFQGTGGYEPVAEVLFERIKVHGYFMEYDSERAGGFEPLRHVPKDRVVVLGLVTTKSGQLESRDAIRRRIDEATRYIPLEQLCLSGQCGFASTEEGNTLTEEAQWRKLELIVGLSQEIWA